MSSQMAFQEKFSTFIKKCPLGFNYCLEIRNPNYLNEKYFHFLKSVNLSHVFLQGYYMPFIFDLYEKYHDLIVSQQNDSPGGDNYSDYIINSGSIKWEINR